MAMPCAFCLCQHSDRAPYRWYELVLALVLVAPYRCTYCQGRFLAGLWSGRRGG